MQPSFYQRYLFTEHWRELRQDKLSAIGNKCERCGRKTRLEVHHLTYERFGKERPSDLQVLCEDCHHGHHTRELEARFEKGKPRAEKDLRDASTLRVLMADREALVRSLKTARGPSAKRINRELVNIATRIKKLKATVDAGRLV